MKHTHIASSTPNRTRVKLSQKRRNADEMARIVHALKEHRQIIDIRPNVNTGSIVIYHAEDEGNAEDIQAILQDLGIILGKVADVPIVEGKSEVAKDLTHAIYDLNQRVGQASGGLVDLRFLVPVGLGTLAIHQLLRNGWQFETVPWYVLAWYSFDSFIKLHYTSDPEQKNS
ncbi:HMA2 domain-containing protein [Aerosakkonemataceae cyanobacterium BLCC-F154]|uniref:HMA2 domain-containing protein n=1 Tax=Floridaenema fluviatile BLCC-F154 TaxID=3153640 RepID=A0ABV4YCQ6_9CYAN